MEVAITKQWLGEILQIWVRLPDRAAVNVASDSDGLSRDALIVRAKSYWQYRDTEDSAAHALKQSHPDGQVFIGILPCQDIQTNLQGRFAYTLKARKSKGKFQIEDYITL